MNNASSPACHPAHGYLLVLLLGAALSAPLLLSSRAAGARMELLQATPSPRAQEPRTLAVHATGEVLTTPDELTLSFRIESFHRSLKAAKADNDGKIRQALQLIARSWVPSASVQTGEFTILPRMEGPYEHRTLTGYDVVKRVTVSRCDIDRADGLLQELFEGSANVLEGVHFAPSKLQEKRAEARKLAVQAARQKAEVIAGELGQRVGHPLKIEEAGEPGFGVRQSNMITQNDSSPLESGTLAAGKARVQASVAVVFELVDG
ncbi:MAG: SIMPL domain-containing protein [Polyangiaceae bacterium]|nr:SIMPL domain-containing protein [Polyangiaceae bacterium]